MVKPIKKKMPFRIVLKGRAKIFITKMGGKRYVRVVYNYEKIEKQILKQLIKPILKAGKIKKSRAKLCGFILYRFPTDVSSDKNALFMNRTVRR